MDLASGICRSPVDTGVTHVRRLFGTQLVQRELRVDPQGTGRVVARWECAGTFLLGGKLWGG